MQTRGTALVIDTVVAKLPVMSGTAVISGSGTTVALTDLQSNSAVLLDRNTGMTWTLPSPAVPGTKYEFFVTRNLASGTYILTGTAANASYVFIGGVSTYLDNLATGSIFMSNGANQAGTVYQKVQLSATTGGTIGTRLVVTALSRNTWHVTGLAIGTGAALATPFTA